MHLNKKTIYDYSNLRKKIFEVCGTQYEFANRIGLSDRSVSFKMTNQRDWKQREIETAIAVLGIPRNDIPKYFYAPYLIIIE